MSNEEEEKNIIKEGPFMRITRIPAFYYRYPDNGWKTARRGLFQPESKELVSEQEITYSHAILGSDKDVIYLVRLEGVNDPTFGVTKLYTVSKRKLEEQGVVSNDNSVAATQRLFPAVDADRFYRVSVGSSYANRISLAGHGPDGFIYYAFRTDELYSTSDRDYDDEPRYSEVLLVKADPDTLEQVDHVSVAFETMIWGHAYDDDNDGEIDTVTSTPSGAYLEGPYSITFDDSYAYVIYSWEDHSSTNFPDYAKIRITKINLDQMTVYSTLELTQDSYSNVVSRQPKIAMNARRELFVLRTVVQSGYTYPQMYVLKIDAATMQVVASSAEISSVYNTANALVIDYKEQVHAIAADTDDDSYLRVYDRDLNLLNTDSWPGSFPDGPFYFPHIGKVVALIGQGGGSPNNLHTIDIETLKVEKREWDYNVFFMHMGSRSIEGYLFNKEYLAWKQAQEAEEQA